MFVFAGCHAMAGGKPIVFPTSVAAHSTDAGAAGERESEERERREKEHG